MFGKMLTDKFNLDDQMIAKYNSNWEIQVANGMVGKRAFGGA